MLEVMRLVLIEDFLTAWFDVHTEVTLKFCFKVRFQAVKAASSFILLNDKDNQVLHCFSGLLAPIIQIIMESVDKQEDEALIKSLIDLAEACPKFLRPRLDTILEMCIKVRFFIILWRSMELT